MKKETDAEQTNLFEPNIPDWRLEINKWPEKLLKFHKQLVQEYSKKEKVQELCEYAAYVTVLMGWRKLPDLEIELKRNEKLPNWAAKLPTSIKWIVEQ